MEYTIRREGNDDYLEHFGIKGQKWGVRRYENKDGTLTPEGREHYGIGQGDKYRKADGSYTKKGTKEAAKIQKFQNDDSFSMRKLKEKGRRAGMTESEIYGTHKAARAAMIGTILGGPLAGITAGMVSNHRYKKSGKAFAESILG